MKTYIFSENNSGGHWWLNRSDYEKLFDNGWEYDPSLYDLEHGYNVNPFNKDSKKDDCP